MSKQPFVTDIKMLRERARRHIEQGAVTEGYPAERIAIDSYKEIIGYLGDKDSTTRRMFEEILAVEEEHADDLVSLLGGMPKRQAGRNETTRQHHEKTLSDVRSG